MVGHNMYVFSLSLSLSVCVCVVFPPVITGEPCDVKAKPHCEANFVVDASCEEPMTYAWQTKKRDGDSDGGGWRDVGSGSEVSGGDTRCLVVADVREEEDAGLYRCVVSSEGGNSTTREVSLEIGWTTRHYSYTYIH